MTFWLVLLGVGVIGVWLHRRQQRREFSDSWHHTIDRHAWTQGYEGARWDGSKVDQQTWKPGR